jgi:hypothetical protein
LQDVDLFQDLVDQQGQMEIWIGCSEGSQYFGMAQPDVYIRGREGSFAWNFTKAYLGIWLQMVIITFFGVMFSTFLTGSVAMFATAIVYTIGLFKEFVLDWSPATCRAADRSNPCCGSCSRKTSRSNWTWDR